jgi:hypothetical protein
MLDFISATSSIFLNKNEISLLTFLCTGDIIVSNEKLLFYLLLLIDSRYRILTAIWN